ncbi:conserved hypothetical protein [Leishmania major strain Friedlin]|uniref:Transmembrane protein n=1 Tax=Leishmania major TaxID=5664 RepID=Q4Q5R3_LEIMA|nr:conserved hypothetical protein [Leishmania major strain Friedlin]CAG9579958.1 hypothetical_protein_-_conserved [Leishmania major strain Friedlin]CAJ08477.1 conserved hypothetical protein [Leishmania major strain Friedlin]|eukprot:XP_001685335.1 conserved hypothetical protein [Leishmania major strain Friedlin]
MFTFSCQCQSCRGNLVATEKEFYFTSSLFRIDLGWGNVKRIRLETQQVKGVPTSVLVVVLQHNESIKMQASSPSAQKKRLLSSRKYFFYDFHDLLGAEEQMKRLLEQYRASEKAKKDEARDDSEKGSSATTKQQTGKPGEKDEVSTSISGAPKDESLNNTRTTTNRNPDSDARRTALGLPLAGRRAPPSSSLRPKLSGKLVSIPVASASKVQSGKYARLFLKFYRHVAAVLIVVMLALLTRHYTHFDDLHVQSPLQRAEKLLRDIHALSDVNARLESYDSHETLRQYNKRRKDLAEESRTFTHQLEQAAMKLMGRYVALQAKMATLRGHRAQRVAHEQQRGTPSPPPPSTMSTVFGTPMTAADRARLFSQRGEACQARAGDGGAAKTGAGRCGSSGAARKKAAKRRVAPLKSMSLLRLKSDVQRWARRAQSAWHYAISFIFEPPVRPSTHPAPSAGEHHGSAGEAAWTVYTEKMGEYFRLTEWVSAAEHKDRLSCLQLTQELLETVEMTERVFATFSNVFLMDRYRKLESGEERASHWMQPPQALRTVTGDNKYYAANAFSSEEVAHVAMLRRFVGSLVHSEPLEADQPRRRRMALRVADAMLSYRESEVQLLRARNQGRPVNATELWRVLEEKVLRPATMPLRENPDIDNSTVYLRNPIAELRFWHTHEAAWREHVLSFFSPEEQAEIRSSLDTDDHSHQSLVDLTTPPVELQWVNLPLFRGLLCFEGTSHLQGSASEVADDAAGDLAHASEDEDNGNADETASDIGEDNTEESPSNTSSDRASTRPHTPVISAYLLPAPPTHRTASTTKKMTPSNRTNTATSRSSKTPETPPDVTASPHAQSSRAEDLWKEVKLRWMDDLNVFRLAFDADSAGRSAHAAHLHCTDNDERGVVADAAEVHCRLSGILSLINEFYVRYLTPTALQRFAAFLRVLFPPYFQSHSSREVYISALRSWGAQDPAVQLAIAQVTGFAPGTTSDVSRSLLYIVLQPPPLLQASVVSARHTTVAVMVLVLFGGVLTALYMMQ